MAELGAAGCSYLLMRSLEAPKVMTAMMLSVATGMVIITGVTLFWKISMHVSGAAGTVMLIVLLYGKQWIPLFLFIPVVGWSRSILEHHSVAQAATGAMLGSLVPAIVFRAMHLSPRASSDPLSKSPRVSG
jgi:membrane-associated phospholipid phosphatase